MNRRRPTQIDDSAGAGIPLAIISAVAWAVITGLLALVLTAIEHGVTPV